MHDGRLGRNPVEVVLQLLMAPFCSTFNCSDVCSDHWQMALRIITFSQAWERTDSRRADATHILKPFSAARTLQSLE